MNEITERHVQAIWYDLTLRPQRLCTRRGSEVRVVSPGEWNLGAGPDFKNAVLEIGKEHRRIVGDVEVHICPSDWDFHGHGTDPNYRNVIAHVTWKCGPVPSSLPSGAVSIWLGRFFAGDTAFSPESIDLMAYPYARLSLVERPCQKTIGHDPSLAAKVLRSAGEHRLRMKARRLAGRLCARPVKTDESRRQIFYEEVMTALGYRRNTTQFRRIATRVPVSALPAENEMARVALLTAGGFEDWNRAGLRPNNFPERRLEAAADIFTRTPIMEYCDAVDFSKRSCRMMVAAICGDHFIGRGRAAAVVSNVLLPFALAEDRLTSVPDWLPPEDISGPVRLTGFRMFGRDHNPAVFGANNGLCIQGLLQIHRDYCLQFHPDCDGCGLVCRQG